MAGETGAAERRCLLRLWKALELWSEASLGRGGQARREGDASHRGVEYFEQPIKQRSGQHNTGRRRCSIQVCFCETLSAHSKLNGPVWHQVQVRHGEPLLSIVILYVSTSWDLRKFFAA